MRPFDGERRGYHHGNLKEELVRAALHLISEKGPSGFTVAEAARLAGVSPTAPYRHYRDKTELMADVATRGFGAFETALQKAWDDGRPTPWEAFRRMGQAYIAFAREEPAYYSAMFEAGVPMEAAPALRLAADRSFQVLRHAAEVLIGTLPAERRPPALMVALHAWASAHGIASLFDRADGGRRVLPMSSAELLEANMLIYLQGLGLVRD
jgi:AcrR family transcriptional regulator